MPTPRILIVYFSETGHTRAAAKTLAGLLDADLESIETAHLGHGFWAWLMRGFAALRGAMPTIVEPRHAAADYDMVVLATPVWAGHISSPMRTYAHSQHAAFKTVAHLLTLGGSGAANAFVDLQHECEKAPLARCAITDRDRKAGKEAEMLAAFAGKIREMVENGGEEKVQLAA
ncbi:MAG: flavodoxin [Rhodospirillaceae bacterium]|nr:flavodoxin [Rhodospirillaceae bacterium]